jgi:GNAT superfamily N-acetyltransferase
MNDASTPQGAAVPSPAWRVRLAAPVDAQAVAAATCELLAELGGKPAEPSQLRAAALGILKDPDSGVLLLAESQDGTVVGYLGASFSSAVRIPGRYGTIEELWVKRDWRGQAIGGRLLEALFELARARGISRIEVGLPGESFAGLKATSAFYAASGFTQVGMRMRRLLG